MLLHDLLCIQGLFSALGSNLDVGNLNKVRVLYFFDISHHTKEEKYEKEGEKYIRRRIDWLNFL